MARRKKCHLCDSPRIPGADSDHDVGCLRWEFCLAWYFIGQAAAQDAVWWEDFALAWLNIGIAAEVLAERDARISRLERHLGDVYTQVLNEGFNFERGRVLVAATAPGVHALSEDSQLGPAYVLPGPSTPMKKRAPGPPEWGADRRVREVLTVQPVADDKKCGDGEGNGRE